MGHCIYLLLTRNRDRRWIRSRSSNLYGGRLPTDIRVYVAAVFHLQGRYQLRANASEGSHQLLASRSLTADATLSLQSPLIAQPWAR